MEPATDGRRLYRSHKKIIMSHNTVLKRMDDLKEERRVTLPMDESIDSASLFGNLDRNIKAVEKTTGTTIIQRGENLLIQGENRELAAGIIAKMGDEIRATGTLDAQKADYIIDVMTKDIPYDEEANVKDIICYTHYGKPLRPKTHGQKEYVDCIRRSNMVFGVGPAGTGKTYLACAMAVNALKNREIERIILARPAVEAGESLGFLPGDLQEKVDPYLRPLYDALYEIMGQEASAKLKEKGAIEVVPLAYMRGRTLDNSFIILDEAQNTTREQMKMFLTRMGFHSKVVVTGDITQIDLPKGKGSGLLEASRVLRNVEGIEFCYLSEVDVVRHELVKRIIKAYNDYEKKGGDRRK